MENQSQSMTKGFAILSVSVLLTKVLAIAYNPVLNNIIGEAAFGIYGITYQVFGFVFIVVSAGMPVAISKMVAQFNAVNSFREVKSTFKIARNLMLLISIFFTLVLMIFCRQIAEFMGFKEAALPIAVIAPCTLFASLSYAYRAYFQGLNNMVPTAVSSFIEQLLNVILSISSAFILIRFGIIWGVVGGTVGTTVGAIASLLYLMYKKKTTKVNLSIEKEVVRRRQRKVKYYDIFSRIIRIALPLIICMGITNFGDIILDSFNINGRLASIGYTEKNRQIIYGNYIKMNQFINVPVALITNLSYSALPAFSAFFALKKHKEANEKIKYTYKLTFLVVIPFAVAFSALSKSIYGIMHYNMYTLLMFGAYNLIFMALIQLQYAVLQSIGKLYQLTAFSIIGFISKYIVNFFFVGNSIFNIYGALIGIAVGNIIVFSLNQVYLKKTLNMKLSLFTLCIKPILSSILMGVVAFLVNMLLHDILIEIGAGNFISNAVSLVFTAIISIAVYVAMMYVIGGFEKDDLDLLPRRIVSKIPNRILNRIKAEA